jgi:hypothetical protein
VDKGQLKFFKELCRRSKNLYNSTLYETRQHFFKCGQFLTYNNAYHVMKGLGQYNKLPTLNADVNGALGIMIKSTGKRDIVSRLNSGTVTVPRRIRLREIQQTSSVRLAQNIFGLIQAPPLAVG